MPAAALADVNPDPDAIALPAQGNSELLILGT